MIKHRILCIQVPSIERLCINIKEHILESGYIDVQCDVFDRLVTHSARVNVLSNPTHSPAHSTINAANNVSRFMMPADSSFYIYLYNML